MAKKHTFRNSKAVANALVTLQSDPNAVSRFLKLQLVDKGFLDVTQVKKTDGRGRPSKVYVVNGKGRGLVALSKNWK